MARSLRRHGIGGSGLVLTCQVCGKKYIEKNFKVREIQPYGAAVDASASIGCQLFILKS